MYMKYVKKHKQQFPAILKHHAQTPDSTLKQIVFGFCFVMFCFILPFPPSFPFS